MLIIQKIQHVLPSPVLMRDGLTRLSAGAFGWSLVLAGAEVVTGALVIGSFLLAARRAFIRKPGDHVHHGIDWVDLFLGLMLAVEVFVHHEETGRIQRPTVLLSVTMVVFGLMHGRMLQRVLRHMMLRVDDRGVTAGAKFFRTFSARWKEIADITVGDADARIRTRDGRERRFNLKNLTKGAEVRDALLAARVEWQQQQLNAGAN
jgi:hypothetical protein